MFLFEGDKVFADRKDAGIQLGKMLESRFKDKNALVLGVARGGVEIAYHVAKILNGDLSVIVSKKLPYPGQPEFACGAVTEDGSFYLSSYGKQLSQKVVNALIRLQLEETHRRIDQYRGGRPLPDMAGRIVLIVDDGIATGSTIVPTLKLCRAKKASKVIVAVPVSGDKYTSEIDELADEVVVLEVPEDYYAVGQVYDDFHGLSDEEVVYFLNEFEKEKRGF